MVLSRPERERQRAAAHLAAGALPAPQLRAAPETLPQRSLRGALPQPPRAARAVRRSSVSSARSGLTRSRAWAAPFLRPPCASLAPPLRSPCAPLAPPVRSPHTCRRTAPSRRALRARPVEAAGRRAARTRRAGRWRWRGGRRRGATPTGCCSSTTPSARDSPSPRAAGALSLSLSLSLSPSLPQCPPSPPTLPVSISAYLPAVVQLSKCEIVGADMPTSVLCGVQKCEYVGVE